MENTNQHITHEIDTVEKVEYLDRNGNKKIRLVPIYKRTAAQEIELEKKRLGTYFEIPPLDLAPTPLKRPLQLLVVGSEADANRIISTRLRADHSPHKILIGSDLLQDYLSDSAAPALRTGYEDYSQVFLLFGYVHVATNKALPSLVMQLMGTRRFKNLHLWIFLPCTVSSIVAQWPQDDGILSGLDTLPSAVYDSSSKVLKSS